MMANPVPAKMAAVLLDARRFRTDRSGLAAVEFAFILPLMLMVFFGTIEISNGVGVDRKVTLAARTLSDLVSQGTTTSGQDITNFFTIGNSIMSPYTVTPMTLRVSAINIDGAGVAKVAWSDGSKIAARAVGATVTIPAGLVVNNTQLIWSEVTYTYTPVVGYVVKNSLTLTDQCFTRPRQSATVARVS